MRVPSVIIAKDRLKNLLIADRVQCTPESIQLMSTEIYQTISKYIEVDPATFQMNFTHTDIHIHYINDRRKN